ncbi:hypothetical protein DID77_03955 [Candidatus Marinamargulisbacteria bacterium SCGC AG-439-L15]|nr:hypothetical protein DID77_03955 [Candidatus Marinamargulisbacteria bacterium SCGC AG-439-L15]
MINLLWPIRTLLRLIRDIDGWLSYFMSRFFTSQYKLEGTCLKRGVCCQNIAIYLHSRFWSYQILKKMVILWYQFVYSFTYKSEDPSSQIILFSCQYLKNNRCQIHWRRPVICRRYPQPRHFGRPILLPGCGYKINPK